MKALLVTHGIPVPEAPPQSLTSDETSQEGEDVFEFSISSGASDSSKSAPQQARINVKRQSRRKGVSHTEVEATSRQKQVPNCTLFFLNDIEWPSDSAVSRSAIGPQSSDTSPHSSGELIVCKSDATAIGMDFILS